MSERNALDERSQELLVKIDEIVANRDDEDRATDSLYGFCAHLASTVPQADDTFQARLEARLVAGVGRSEARAEEPSPRQSLAELGRVARRVGWNPLAMRPRWALAAVALCAVVAVTLLAYPLVAQFGALIGNTVPARRETPQVTYAPTPTPDGRPTHTPVVLSSPTKVVEGTDDRMSQSPAPLGYVSTWAIYGAR